MKLQQPTRKERAAGRIRFRKHADPKNKTRSIRIDQDADEDDICRAWSEAVRVYHEDRLLADTIIMMDAKGTIGLWFDRDPETDDLSCERTLPAVLETALESIDYDHGDAAPKRQLRALRNLFTRCIADIDKVLDTYPKT